MLLGLVSFLFSFEFVFLSLQYGLLGQVFKLVSLLKLLPKGCNLLLGRNQLTFYIIGQLPLTLCLCLSTLQCSLSAFSLLLLSLQLLFEVSIALLSNGQRLHSRGPSSSLLIQLLCDGMINFFHPKRALNSLFNKKGGRLEGLPNQSFLPLLPNPLLAPLGQLLHPGLNNLIQRGEGSPRVRR